MTPCRSSLRADLRADLQSRILDGPMAEAYLRFRPHLRPLQVGSRSDLVIEAFPRSGSSFARSNVIVANPDVTVSSHLHSVRSVVRATRRGIPCMVLVRDPRDCVSSYLQFQPGVSARTAFGMYCRFYEGVEPYLDDCLVVPFDSLIADFDRVLAKVNARFDSTFRGVSRTGTTNHPSGRSPADSDVDAHLQEAAALVAARLGRHPDEIIGMPRDSRRSAEEMLAHLRPVDARAQDAAQRVWKRVRGRAVAES